MTGRASRSKGQAGEREVVDIIRGHGWSRCHRNHQSGGQGGGDIANGPEGTHWEVKRTERVQIQRWVNQAESEAAPHDIPIVAYRSSRDKWRAVIDLDDLLDLLSFRESA